LEDVGLDVGIAGSVWMLSTGDSATATNNERPDWMPGGLN
jgi:hypothetical protein